MREHYKKLQRSEPIEERDFAAPPSTVVDHTIRRALELVMRKLKPRERDFVKLYYYDELSKSEISRRLGIDEDRLRLVKSRTLKSFREMYLRLTGD